VVSDGILGIAILSLEKCFTPIIQAWRERAAEQTIPIDIFGIKLEIVKAIHLMAGVDN
jgi:hypothetical protein